MKKRIFKLSIITSIALLAFNACETPTDNPDDTDVRSAYVGSWSCSEGGMTYTVTISLNLNNSAQVQLGNFHYFGAGEKAFAVATTNNLTISQQTVFGNIVRGSGNLANNNRIEMLYYVDNLSAIDTVNAIYSR